MKDGFELTLSPQARGLFLFKNVFVMSWLELIFAVLKKKGFRRPLANVAPASNAAKDSLDKKEARSSKG